MQILLQKYCNLLRIIFEIFLTNPERIIHINYLYYVDYDFIDYYVLLCIIKSFILHNNQIMMIIHNI